MPSLPFIQVASDFINGPQLIELAEALSLTSEDGEDAVLGKWNRVWDWSTAHARALRGHIPRRTAVRMIEQAARWRGERGAFYRAAVATGLLREHEDTVEFAGWMERYGEVLEQSEKERLRSEGRYRLKTLLQAPSEELLLEWIAIYREAIGEKAEAMVQAKRALEEIRARKTAGSPPAPPPPLQLFSAGSPPENPEDLHGDSAGPPPVDGDGEGDGEVDLDSKTTCPPSAAGAAEPAEAKESTGQQKPPARKPRKRSEAEQFWAWAQEQRRKATGLIPEAAPDTPKLNAWYRRVLDELGGQGERLQRAWAAYLRHPRDGYWPQRGFPFQGFASDNEWRKHVPPDDRVSA